MNCSEYRQHASAPEPATQEVADAHRADCAACASWSQTLEDAVSAIDLPDVEPSAGDWERLSAALDRPATPTAPAAVSVRLQCTYCHDALATGQEGSVYCASCLAPHHLDCFRQNSGCATPACPGVSTVTPVAQVHEGVKPWGAPKTTGPRRRVLPWLLGATLLSGAALAAWAWSDPDRDELAQQVPLAETLPSVDPAPREVPAAVELEPEPAPQPEPTPQPEPAPQPEPSSEPRSFDDPPGTTYALVVGSGYDPAEAERVVRWLEASLHSPLATVQRETVFGAPDRGFGAHLGALVWRGDPLPYYPAVLPLKSAGREPAPWATDSPGRYQQGPAWPTSLPFPEGSFDREVVLRACDEAGEVVRSVPFRRTLEGIWHTYLPMDRDPFYGPDKRVIRPRGVDNGAELEPAELTGGYPGHAEHQIAVCFRWRQVRGASPAPSDPRARLVDGKVVAPQRLSVIEGGALPEVAKPLPEAPRIRDALRPRAGGAQPWREVRASSFQRPDPALLRAVRRLAEEPPEETGELGKIGPRTWGVTSRDARWVREQNANLIAAATLHLVARWARGEDVLNLVELRLAVEDRSRELPWVEHGLTPPADRAYTGNPEGERGLTVVDRAHVLSGLALSRGSCVISIAGKPAPDSITEAEDLFAAIAAATDAVEVVAWEPRLSARTHATLRAPGAAAPRDRRR